MGGCPAKCEVKCGNGLRYEGSTLELNFEHQKTERNINRNRSASSSRQGESSTFPATHFHREQDYSDNILHTQSDPKNEFIASNIEIELLPVFVTTKYINESTVKQRQNRFMEDLEIEVKARIQEIKQEEQEERQRFIINDIVRKQLEFQKIKSELISKSQNNYLENSQKFNQKQQISPNKDASKESKDSQFASLQSSSLMLSSEKQSNIQSTVNKTDPLKYSTQNQHHQKKAFEKIISNYYIEDNSCSCNSKKKGILKQHKIPLSLTSKSLPNKTQAKSKLFKKKRVHFSQETNFNFEKKSEDRKHSRTWWKSIF
ncbi:unnamed protein product (macronuclear) [Paramecium tetraurelia]|uniref:Uncharacterized protein n=1 Tax=Paramecium tetraurelia TaxID=5888 RepID=A0DJI5_PARTE|nr:uncharacterized protein GSPATT00017546001 [Paramecium tetraurelia]CAK83202.1 unnamed protein product [Paramecium tetraurelia]|eukprot:XP_001450599.1 hypothetical protein (macronuclear) [Paramecium tetraurelia strain d4-2]